MVYLQPRFAALLLLFGSAALPALAASSTSSAASDSASTSVGSVSNSFERSSHSSSKGDKVAEGDYKVIEVALAPDRPDTLRLQLQAVADASPEGEFFLYLPRAAAEQGRVAAGQTVSARLRPYGLEFVQADTGQPFFLVLQDDWYRELQTRLVTL